jgi:hypothetical protein
MYLFILLGTRGDDGAGSGRPGVGPVGSVTDNQQQESHKNLALCCKPWYNEAKQKGAALSSEGGRQA